MNVIFLTFFEVWTQWVVCQVNKMPFGCSYFDECQKNEIYLLNDPLILDR